jgi:hypothetical protein
MIKKKIASQKQETLRGERKPGIIDRIAIDQPCRYQSDKWVNLPLKDQGSHSILI